MKYHPDLHHRKSIRLKHYNYSQNGAYFITLCAKNRQCLFGEIINNKITLNDLGNIVREEWKKSFQIRYELEIDEFVIMPNHFHGIVFITRKSEQGYNYKSNSDQGPKNKSISSLVAGFKSSVTSKINALQKQTSESVWQRNYHEHVIRNEKSLQRIREYTINNPLTWKEDSLFEDCS